MNDPAADARMTAVRRTGQRRCEADGRAVNMFFILSCRRIGDEISAVRPSCQQIPLPYGLLEVIGAIERNVYRKTCGIIWARRDKLDTNFS
jgi:hypothetical protein